MKDQGTPINFISFLRRPETNSVCDAIKTLNYHVRLINAERWLQHNLENQSQSAIIALPSSGLNYEKALDIIRKGVHISHCLVVFSEPIIDFFLPILVSCQDCCRWPCIQDELDLRLERLCSINSNDEIEIQAGGYPERNKWTDLNLVGSSPVFLKVLSFIENASRCDAPVLIEGETGTGKEMVARGVHYRSGRSDYPFIPINCGAIPDNLLENELFGHEKGAYTDAKQSQSGLLEQANGGTLFLDEIEALSVKGQVVLLRFLEDQKIKPLGGKAYKKVNVRIITASNIPLAQLVEQSYFRQDLMFRLNLLQLEIPPLRERTSDIQCLAGYFLQKFSKQYKRYDKKLSVDTREWMNRHQWPGNVRELENFVHRQFLINEAPCSAKQKAKAEFTERRTALDRRLSFVDHSFNEAKHSLVNQFEQRYLTDLMARTNGNVTQAAKFAQKERRALGKLLVKNNINPTLFRN